MTKEIAVNKETQEVESLIGQAISKGASIETLEKLLAMRKELKAEQAREAFTDAIATFQSECPVIKKEKKVMNKDGKSIRYKYAPLDSIVSQVQKPLAEAGLSYSFDEKKDDKSITAICKITHKLGHSEISSFQIPIGAEEYMSDPQKHGARITFAKRYAFCNALGILTGDEDSDATEDKKSNEKIEALKPKIEEITNLEDLKKLYEEHKGLGNEFASLITAQKKFIIEANKE